MSFGPSAAAPPGKVVAVAMKADDWAFFDTGVKGSTTQIRNSSMPSSIVNTALRNGKLAVSLTLDQPSNIALRLTTVSGRTVRSAAGIR